MPTRTIQRHVPVSEGAAGRMARKIVLQPRQLRVCGGAADLAVQRNHVPAAQFDTVITVAGARATLGEVGRRTRGAVLVVAGRGPGAVLEAAPRGLVTGGKFAGRAGGIGMV